jgi:hypothetical protein
VIIRKHGEVRIHKELFFFLSSNNIDEEGFGFNDSNEDIIVRGSEEESGSILMEPRERILAAEESTIMPMDCDSEVSESDISVRQELSNDERGQSSCETSTRPSIFEVGIQSCALRIVNTIYSHRQP